VPEAIKPRSSMSRKIFKLAAVFVAASVALAFWANTAIKDPTPRPTLEWSFFPKDSMLDIKLEAYRMRMAVANAYGAFLAQAGLALASMGAAGLVLRRIRAGIFHDAAARIARRLARIIKAFTGKDGA
jgi:hypothetical protein